MKIDPRIDAAKKAAAAVEQKYGLRSGSTGPSTRSSNIVPTGSLLWDYQSGIGGRRLGTLEEVFGPPSIGKTTIAAFSTVRNAQAQGMLTGYIAVEPDVDEDWMVENGINLDYNVMARPDSGEEAFGILHDWVYGGVVDYIIFDSIGHISSEKEIDSDKPQAYGNSALITWGIKRIAARAWKNDVGCLFINQVRDDTKARIAGLVESPGGWAFKHAMKIRTQLKPGKDRYKIKINDGVENKDVVAGQEIIASFKKNKAAESLGKSARFEFFHMHTDEHPFGFNVGQDLFRAAKVSGVIEQTGSNYNHPVFPKGKINGKDRTQEWFAEHPEVHEQIRNEVLAVMTVEERKKAEAKRRAKAAGENKLKVVGE
jgi:recombination protein RecA